MSPQEILSSELNYAARDLYTRYKSTKTHALWILYYGSLLLFCRSFNISVKTFWKSIDEKLNYQDYIILCNLPPKYYFFDFLVIIFWVIKLKQKAKIELSWVKIIKNFPLGVKYCFPYCYHSTDLCGTRKKNRWW